VLAKRRFSAVRVPEELSKIQDRGSLLKIQQIRARRLLNVVFHSGNGQHYVCIQAAVLYTAFYGE